MLCPASDVNDQNTAPNLCSEPCAPLTVMPAQSLGFPGCSTTPSVGMAQSLVRPGACTLRGGWGLLTVYRMTISYFDSILLQKCDLLFLWKNRFHANTYDSSLGIFPCTSQ